MGIRRYHSQMGASTASLIQISIADTTRGVILGSPGRSCPTWSTILSYSAFDHRARNSVGCPTGIAFFDVYESKVRNGLVFEPRCPNNASSYLPSRMIARLSGVDRKSTLR